MQQHLYRTYYRRYLGVPPYDVKPRNNKADLVRDN